MGGAYVYWGRNLNLFLVSESPAHTPPGYEASQYSFEGKLLGAVVYKKRSERPIRVYEMREERESGPSTTQSFVGEWMYELIGGLSPLEVRAS